MKPEYDDEVLQIIRDYLEKDRMSSAMNRIEVARAKVLEDILLEREYQEHKWGDQVENSNELWNVIATEEVGEAAREIYEHGNNLYGELIQCAAVYMAWAEALRRNEVQLDEEHC